MRTCALGRPGVARIADAGVLGAGRSAVTMPTIGPTITAHGATASCPIVASLTVASGHGASSDAASMAAIVVVTARGATASRPIVAILTVASMAGTIRNTIPISAIGTVTAGRVVARAAARKAARTAAGALLVL